MDYIHGMILCWGRLLSSMCSSMHYSCNFCFISGAKIHQSGGKTRCIERGGVNYTLEESSDIPEPIASYLQHAMEGLRKCKRIESAMTDLEKQSSNGVYFPAIVGQRPRRERKKSSTAASERRPSSVSTVYQQTSPSVLQLPDSIQVQYCG